MKVAIVGSRNFSDYILLKKTLEELNLDISCIISGGAKGADSLAERYAEELSIRMMVFEPDWDMHGKKAGFLRNNTIVRNCDILVAFWDGESRGTLDSINKATQSNKTVHIVRF